MAADPQELGFDYSFSVPTGVQGPLYVAYENGAWAKFSSNSQPIHLDASSALDPVFVSDKGPGCGDSQWDATVLNQILADKAAAFILDNAPSDAPFFLNYWSPAVHVPHTPPEKIDGVVVSGTTPSKHTDMNRVLDWEVAQIVSPQPHGCGWRATTLLSFPPQSPRLASTGSKTPANGE